MHGEVRSKEEGLDVVQVSLLAGQQIPIKPGLHVSSWHGQGDLVLLELAQPALKGPRGGSSSCLVDTVVQNCSSSDRRNVGTRREANMRRLHGSSRRRICSLLEDRGNLLEGRCKLRCMLLEGRCSLRQRNLLEGRGNLLECRGNLLECRGNLLECRGNLLECREQRGRSLLSSRQQQIGERVPRGKPWASSG
jgi:hypothetical protein